VSQGQEWLHKFQEIWIHINYEFICHMNSYAERTAYLCLWTWCVSNLKSELCNNKCRVDDDGKNEDKDEQWNRGEARIFYIIRLLAVRWAGSYNDNVLSALPWVRRHRPWWNKLLRICGPSSGRHGWEVLLAAHFVSVLCVVLHFTWLSKDMNWYHVNSYVYMNSYAE
jgi:hypothetical protein